MHVLPRSLNGNVLSALLRAIVGVEFCACGAGNVRRVYGLVGRGVLSRVLVAQRDRRVLFSATNQGVVFQDATGASNALVPRGSVLQYITSVHVFQRVARLFILPSGRRVASFTRRMLFGVQALHRRRQGGLVHLFRDLVTCLVE